MEKERIAFKDVRDLVNRMRRSGLQEIEWRSSTWSVRLRNSDSAPCSAISTVASAASIVKDIQPLTTKTVPVCSPIPGYLLLHNVMSEQPLINHGMKVKKNDLLALIKVGPVYLPVRSPIDGIVDDIICSDGSILEYGTEIALLRPSEDALELV